MNRCGSYSTKQEIFKTYEVNRGLCALIMGCILSFFLFLSISTATAAETVRDEFSAVSYSNNDGTVNWKTNWIEDDDFGQGAASGQVAIEGGALTLEDQPNTGTEPSAEREVDLTGSTAATFSFNFSTTSGVDTNDSVVVEVSNDGGGNWTSLENFTGIGGATSGARTFDIAAFISDDTRVRFRVNNMYGGQNEMFLVDNIEISFSSGGSTACQYDLNPSSGQPGTATVDINASRFLIQFTNARPNTLYTIWADHRNRGTLQLADDYPLGEGALARGVAPVFGTTAGVTSGMGLDANSIITNSQGNATLSVPLDYNLLGRTASPVVGAGLNMQGVNRVGGGWLRVYPEDQEVTASLQVTDPGTGLPLLHRSTVQGITVQWHPDDISHGHTPGVGGVDHFPAFSGDFPQECSTGNGSSDDDDDD